MDGAQLIDWGNLQQSRDIRGHTSGHIISAMGLLGIEAKWAHSCLGDPGDLAGLGDRDLYPRLPQSSQQQILHLLGVDELFVVLR